MPDQNAALPVLPVDDVELGNDLDPVLTEVKEDILETSSPGIDIRDRSENAIGNKTGKKDI